MAHALPPPPEPPAPPMPPPPRVPPLPPMPPAPPPDGIIGLRTWSPSTYNTAPEGLDDGSNALFYLYCKPASPSNLTLQLVVHPACLKLHRRLRPRVRRQRRHNHHRLSRALPQVVFAALRPDHGASHDRPGHLPLERVPVRVLAQDHPARGGAEQRGQHALGARHARRGVHLPGARRRSGQGLLALRKLGRSGRHAQAAPAAHEPQRDHGPVRRDRAPAPAACAARRVAREPRARGRLCDGRATGRLRPLPRRALGGGRRHLARLLQVRAHDPAPGARGHVVRRRHHRCDRAHVEREGVQLGAFQGVPLVERIRPGRRGVQLPAQTRREQHRHAVHPARHARRKQGGLPAALAAATLSAQPPASALAAARLDPLRALGRREHQGLQGARV